MFNRIYVALFTALIVFGGVATTTTGAYAFDARCGGDFRPLCRTRTVERCVAWYPCGTFERCCKTWERSTIHDYFRSEADNGDWLPEAE